MHPKYLLRWEKEWYRLKKAAYILYYINNYCDDSDDIYSTFKIEKIEKIIEDTIDGIDFNLKLARDTGFIDAIDIYFDEIINGLDMKYFPESELNIITEFGSKDPKTDLEGLIYLLKLWRKKHNSLLEKLPVSRQIEGIKRKLLQDKKQLDFGGEKKESEPHQKKPRLFKSLGQIISGSALSLGNMALVIGILKVPVSPETQTWGALVSVTTGIGKILQGIGDFRVE